MAAQSQKKRKHGGEVVTEPIPFSEAVGLEMGSDEEAEGEGSGSDDGEVDEFPEIDTRTDSEDEDFSQVEGDSDDEEEEEEEDAESTSSDADSDLHIFPESKTVVSQITGQPKRVYPEIEPDYDSDSSTEDVRLSLIRRRTHFFLSISAGT